MNRQEAMKLMEKRICPVCHKKIEKHSKAKRVFCLSRCQDELGVATSTKMIDGKETNVRVFPASLKEELD